MTLIASPIAPLHLFIQDDQNEMQHDIFTHLTPLASCYVNGMIVFMRSRQLKQCTAEHV